MRRLRIRENENEKSKKVWRISEIEPDFVSFRVSLSVCSVPSVVKDVFEWLNLKESKILVDRGAREPF
jgi:hypothetical protein